MSTRSHPREIARLIPLACRLGLCLLFAACASPEPKKLTLVTELPVAHRELWTAWLHQDPDWSLRREEARGDASLRRFLVDNLIRQMLQNYGDARIANIGATSLGPFERARGEILRFPDEAMAPLTEILAIGNGHASELASSLLEEIGRPAVHSVVLLLERDDPQARRRAADLLGRLPHAHAEEEHVQQVLIKALSSDSEWLVRAKAALAVGSRGSRHTTTKAARTALCRALADKDQAVSVKAVRGLTMLDDPAAVPALINYLERSSMAGVVAGVYEAQDALRKLTGESSSHDVREWRDIWQQLRRRDPNR